MRIRDLALVSLCSVGLACGGGDEAGGDWAGTVTDSAGVQIIENPATGLWPEGGAWQLTEVLRIGSSDGDPDYQFGQIAGITIGETGEVFVLDQQAAQIRVFDAAGTFARSIGSPGAGPGEIGAGASALLNISADTIAVADMGNMRVQHFLEDGTPAGNYRIDMAAGVPIRWQDTPAGLAVVQIRPGMFNTDESAAADSMDAILARTTDGTTADTILRVPAGKTFSMSGGVPEFNFFSPEPVWALAGAGVWYGINNTYEVGLYDNAGQMVRKLKKDFVPSPVSDEDQTIMTDMMRKIFEQQPGMPPQVVDQILSVMEFADNFPAYLQFFSGPESSLWVQHIQIPSELTEEEKESFNPLLSMGSSSWDVFDTDGRFLGEIEMPARFQPLRFTTDRIYGVWRDDLDVQYVMALSVGGTGDRPATIDIGG